MHNAEVPLTPNSRVLWLRTQDTALFQKRQGQCHGQGFSYAWLWSVVVPGVSTGPERGLSPGPLPVSMWA